MSDLAYEPANELGPLKAGDHVEVINSQGIAVGVQTVKRVGSLVVTTRCGRRWTRSHGKWVSELRGRSAVSWPFPSIRKAAAAKEGAHV
ncbi:MULTISPECIES: hypothetical protein [Bacteria]|uniref:hypothetical protein n=1 Tax=Bacteria TaxID=2 RepID=UPI0036FB3962